MSVEGETRIRFGRSYVYLNPDTELSLPEDQRIGTWRLQRDEAPDEESGPVAEGALGYLATVKEPGGVIAGQLVYIESDGIRLAQAGAYSTAVVAGVVLQDGVLDDLVTVTRNETIDFFNVTTLVDGGGVGGFLDVGTNYYLSATTAGNWTSTPDTTTAGAIVQQVGTAVGPHQISVEIQAPVEV